MNVENISSLTFLEKQKEINEEIGLIKTHKRNSKSVGS